MLRRSDRRGLSGLRRDTGRAMSENLNLVRSIYADWERGDFGSADWAHPAIQFVMVGAQTLRRGPATRGWPPAGFRFLEAWDDFHLEADQLRELDTTRVLALIRRSGRGRASRLAVEQMRSLAADVFHVLDGKV